MQNRLYSYVGPDDIHKSAMESPTGAHIRSQADLHHWIDNVETETLPDGTFVATFVVDNEGILRLAPRRSEHVACAGGGPVLSAGEITISPDMVVEEITNQSTGFCPEPESWESVAAALDAIPIERPDDFTIRIIFRLCKSCGQRNLVKDDWYFCGVCDQELPKEWNFAT